ncbi:MAG: hypothetical protein FWC41_02875 [Firmicutes bacterium]|nr:hypothetical protein [Bacillota bacterium]
MFYLDGDKIYYFSDKRPFTDLIKGEVVEEVGIFGNRQHIRRQDFISERMRNYTGKMYLVVDINTGEIAVRDEMYIWRTIVEANKYIDDWIKVCEKTEEFWNKHRKKYNE